MSLSILVYVGLESNKKFISERQKDCLFILWF